MIRNNKYSEDVSNIKEHKVPYDLKQMPLFELKKITGRTYTNKSQSNTDAGSGLKSFQLQNRRYLGNKHKLIRFIRDIVDKKCQDYRVFCDLFSGTGVISEAFNRPNVRIIANDILTSNYIALKSFLGVSSANFKKIKEKILFLNRIKTEQDNYFSEHFAETYFTLKNARKIGKIRETINEIADDDDEKNILITALLYATDKVANTVGHYDAYRKNLNTTNPVNLLMPSFDPDKNKNNQIYKEDANCLITKIKCDVLYMDPPYNSRQYSDAYHLLENLATWKKPPVYGKAKKMDRTHIKSGYCLQAAIKIFSELIARADCRHILLSYNNTRSSINSRSNACMGDEQILDILGSRGRVEVFEQPYKAFTTGKSDILQHTERIFYCEVVK